MCIARDRRAICRDLIEAQFDDAEEGSNDRDVCTRSASGKTPCTMVAAASRKNLILKTISAIMTEHDDSVTRSFVWSLIAGESMILATLKICCLVARCDTLLVSCSIQCLNAAVLHTSLVLSVRSLPYKTRVKYRAS